MWRVRLGNIKRPVLSCPGLLLHKYGGLFAKSTHIIVSRHLALSHEGRYRRYQVLTTHFVLQSVAATPHR